MVLAEVERQVAAAGPRAEASIAALPADTRLRHDLDAVLELARGGSVAHAKVVAGLYLATHRVGQPQDARVLAYIEDARDRYCKAPKRDISKALGLVRQRAGNPRGDPQGRALTKAEREEIAQLVRAQGATGRRAAKDIFAVSDRTIARAVADHREISIEDALTEAARKLYPDDPARADAQAQTWTSGFYRLRRTNRESAVEGLIRRYGSFEDWIAKRAANFDAMEMAADERRRREQKNQEPPKVKRKRRSRNP